MKKVISLFFALLISTVVLMAKTYKYTGNIGPYAVTVTLKEGAEYYSEGAATYITDITGSYTYTKAGNTLRLEGETGYGFLGGTQLQEYTPKGRNSGSWYFEDCIVGEKIMRGTFTNLSTNERFPVTLRLKKK